MYFEHFDFTKPLVWTIPAVFSPQECKAIVASVGEQGWLEATVNAKDGRVVRREIRNNRLALVRNEALRSDLERRILPHLPESLSQMYAVGLKETMRIYRYEVGQFFGLHEDQSYPLDSQTWSLLTLMVYLNDDFKGGETKFPEVHQDIRPQTGTALLFQHRLLHEGAEVTEGIKYTLRTDVFYTKVSPT